MNPGLYSSADEARGSGQMHQTVTVEKGIGVRERVYGRIITSRP
jgi:hypothetical protein